MYRSRQKGKPHSVEFLLFFCSTFQTIRNNRRWLHTANINIYGLGSLFSFKQHKLFECTVRTKIQRNWPITVFLLSLFRTKKWALIGFTFAEDSDLNNVNGRFHQYARIQLELKFFNQQRVCTQTVNKNVNFHLNAVIFHSVDCRYIIWYKIYRSNCLMEQHELKRSRYDSKMMNFDWIFYKMANSSAIINNHTHHERRMQATQALPMILRVHFRWRRIKPMWKS